MNSLVTPLRYALLSAAMAGAVAYYPTAGHAEAAPAATTPAAVAAPDSLATQTTDAALAPPRRALHAAVQAAFEREVAALRELQAQATLATDALAALTIQKRIEAVKVGTEVEILEIQLDYAQRERRDADAQQLAATLEQLRHPPVLRRAVHRPAPQQN